MLKKTNRKIAIVCVVALIAAVVALTLPRLMRVDFRIQLARQLNTDPNFLHLNIPPSPERYPGFSFVVHGSMLPLASPVERSELSIGPTFELQWSELSKNDASTHLAAGPFRDLFSSAADDRISLNLHECRILEADASKLKQRLLGIDSILKHADAGSRILVITRAYEGRLQMKLQRGSHASTGIWAEKVKIAKNTSAAANGDLKLSSADDNQMLLEWSAPVVFAFEAVEAKLFATHLGGKPNDVEFTPVNSSDLLRMVAPEQLTSALTIPTLQPKLKWALCAISSGFYPKIQTLNQSWNSGSAELARQSLEEWKPAICESLNAQEDHPLTDDDVLEFAGKFSKRAKAEGCDLVMAYLVGHSLVNRSGKTALLMGNATREDIDSFVKSSETSLDSSKLLSLSTVYSTFAKSGVPFMILLDGCMDFESVQKALLENSFQFDPLHPDNINYVGPKDLLGPGDLNIIYNSLKQFGKNEDCLTDRNPIIFGSKPGTFARARPNPATMGGPAVGPLAERLYSAVESFQASGQSFPGLDELIRNLGVWRGLGEISLSGPISWSRFDEFEANARRFRPDGPRSVNDATAAITRRLEPGLGRIEDLAFYATENVGWLQIKSIEPSGRNRWDIWRWQPGKPAMKVMDDVLFPKIAKLRESLAVYREPEDGAEVVRLSPSGRTETLSKGSLAGLSSGFDGSSLLILDADNIVDQGGDRLIRFDGTSQSVLFTQELTSARSLIEAAPGQFAWLDDDHEGTIDIRTTSGTVRSVPVGNFRLMALTNASNSLYAIEQNRERLFRVGASGEVKFAWLLDKEERPLTSFEFGFGGLWSVGSELWLANSNEIVCLSPDNLTWGNVQ